MDTIENKDRRRTNWTVLAAVIAVCITFVGQLVGTVYWATTYTATTSVKLDYVISAVKELKDGNYTREEAKRDFERLQESDGEIRRRVQVLENTLFDRLRNVPR